MAQRFLACLALGAVGAAFTGCATFRAPEKDPSAPVVTLLYRSAPPAPFSPAAWRRSPVAIEVANPNAFDVRATVECAYTHFEQSLSAGTKVRVPIVLNDGSCTVEFFYRYQ